MCRVQSIVVQLNCQFYRFPAVSRVVRLRREIFPDPRDETELASPSGACGAESESVPYWRQYSCMVSGNSCRLVLLIGAWISQYRYGLILYG